jgi:hypothetical protein
MKLWYLMRIDYVDCGQDRALLIRAHAAERAREIGSSESHIAFGDSARATCEQMVEQGDEGILIANTMEA